MAYKTIFSTSEAYISADRTDSYLRIRVGNDFLNDRISLSIPRTKVESFLKDLTEIAVAPGWTRAKFVRVHPKGYPSYTMIADGNNTWKSEHGTTHYTDSFLRMADEIDITVLA